MSALSKKALRPRSEVATPYYGLDSALEVPEVVHEQAGGACSRDQLAPLLGYKGTRNGGFISRVGAARMFGLIDESSGLVRLTALANQILSPIQASDAQRGKVAAFFNVELFSKVYERFKGQTLPSTQGMENLFRTEYRVVPAQVSRALRVLTESAESAGFFDAAGRGRLVIPLAANLDRTPQASSATSQPLPAGKLSQAEEPSRKGPESKAVVSEEGIPPAIYGLIRDLPEEGTAMTSAKRQRLIKAFEASINWLYPDADEETLS